MTDVIRPSRRHFIQMAAAGLALSQTLEAKINSRVNGVYVGLQSFSLRTLPHAHCLDVIADAMKTIGIGECELFYQHAEPDPSEVPDLRKWRTTVSMDYFTNIRKKFNKAGIDIYSYSIRLGQLGGAGGGRGAGAGVPGAGAPGVGPGPGAGNQAPPPESGQGPARGPNAAAAPAPPLADEEIDAYFRMAKALGAKTLSTGLQPALAKRVAPFAAKHKMIVAVSSTNPDAFADLIALSPYFKVDIDIGDVTHAGYDPLPYIMQNHPQITDIHLKDSKFKGASVPFGEGDAHIRETLQFLKSLKSQIRAHIDCTYPGTGSSVEEVKRCYDYIKSCLA